MDFKMEKENFKTIFDNIKNAVEMLPNPPRESIKKEIETLQEIIMDNRPPKLMIIGRRGAGKSSLINAIFKEKVTSVGSVFSETGKARWHTYKNEKGEIQLLDTRGIGDETKPESANFENAIEDIKDSIKQNCPDSILFLCKAKEIDGHISHDIKNLKEIIEYILETHKYEIPIVSVITQIDELDPKRIEPPYDNIEKQKNIKKAVSGVEKKLLQFEIKTARTFPISAYAEYEGEKIIYNNYYNIENIIEYLLDVLPKCAKIQLARISTIKNFQEKCARIVIASTSTICAGIAATPIPVADLIPITTAQIGMIASIAWISGRELTKEAAAEFLAGLGLNIGAAFTVREAARALIKLIPGYGNAISSGFAIAATWSIGEAAIAYYINKNSTNESEKIMNEVFEREYK